MTSRDPEHAATLALQHVRVNRQIALRILFGTDDEDAAEQGA